MTPVPDKNCQCKECCVPCAYEMTEEDLLCDICREHAWALKKRKPGDPILFHVHMGMRLTDRGKVHLDHLNEYPTSRLFRYKYIDQSYDKEAFEWYSPANHLNDDLANVSRRIEAAQEYMQRRYAQETSWTPYMGENHYAELAAKDLAPDDIQALFKKWDLS